MNKPIIFCLACLFAAGPARAQDRPRLAGTWKLLSYEIECQETGERSSPFGTMPTGRLILTSDGYMIGFMAAAERKQPQGNAELADAFRTMLAYTGRYRVNGDKWVTKVDGAWIPAWVGTDQERSFKIQGNHLDVTTPRTNGQYCSGKPFRGFLGWEREQP